MEAKFAFGLTNKPPLYSWENDGHLLLLTCAEPLTKATAGPLPTSQQI